MVLFYPDARNASVFLWPRQLPRTAEWAQTRPPGLTARQVASLAMLPAEVMAELRNNDLTADRFPVTPGA